MLCRLRSSGISRSLSASVTNRSSAPAGCDLDNPAGQPTKFTLRWIRRAVYYAHGHYGKFINSLPIPLNHHVTRVRFLVSMHITLFK